MYTCVRALLRLRGDNERLTEGPVGNMPLRELISQYTLVQLVLTHPALDHEVSLMLSDVEDQIFSLRPDITVDQWLVSIGNASLPTSDMVMKKTSAICKYNDVFSANYSVELVHPLAGDGSQLPDDEKTDIKVTKSGMDYKLLFESCLWTVNGVLHISDYSTAGLKIKDAGRSVQHANMNKLGMISFREMGKLSFHPITDEMIIPAPDTPLKNGFTISMPDVSLLDKVVMISMGGVLHFANHRYTVTGDHSILIEWWKFPLAEQYFNTRELIDLSPFEKTMVRNINHGDALDLNQADTDASIKAFMQLSQTFVILLDADNFYYQRHAVEKTGLPGRYYSYQRPQFPLQLENGLLPEYVAFPESEVYTLAVNSNLVARYYKDTRPFANAAEIDRYINQAQISNNPNIYGSAYLLEMGTDFLS